MTLRPNDFDRNGDIIPDAMREDNTVRLIDANALYRKVKTECNPYGKPTIDFESGKKVLDIIDNAPTVDISKEVWNGSNELLNKRLSYLERPQGEWIIVSRNCWKCPYCQELTNEGKNFCSNCGAKMKGGAE